MHPEHTNILREIKKQSGNGNSHSKNDSYLLSGHRYYDVVIPERRRIAKRWLKEHTAISNREFLALISSLYSGESHEEKTIASMLLGYHTEGRRAVTTKHLDRWLSELVGWAEIDALCHNVFTAEELTTDWATWKRFIEKLSKDTNMNKRRAALVFLTGPAHHSADQQIRKLAFAMVERLKYEKHILITKAISWLLREMVAQHKESVRRYIHDHADTLPKIAVRETLRKIETGKKN